jgi:hypothetical protein
LHVFVDGVNDGFPGEYIKVFYGVLYNSDPKWDSTSHDGGNTWHWIEGSQAESESKTEQAAVASAQADAEAKAKAAAEAERQAREEFAKNNPPTPFAF